MDITKFTDDRIKKYQKQTLKVCAFCENGIRIGVATPKFIALAENAQKFLAALETEFFKRHPEEIQHRNQQFLRICESLIDGRNFEEFGNDPAAAGIEYFTEYHTPEQGKKRATCRKTFLADDGEPRVETTAADHPMNEVDFLFAEIEDAMDEFAETLPDTPDGE